MTTFARATPTVLSIVAWTIGLSLAGLFVGIERTAAPNEISTSVLESGPAKMELAVAIADDFKAASPVLGGIPALDGLILKALNSPRLESSLPEWIEHVVRRRLGQDVGPLLIRPGDLIQVSNPILNFGIQAVPAIQIELRPSATDHLLSIASFAMPVALLSAAASYLITRKLYGRSSAAILAGAGGIAATACLVSLRVLAALHSVLADTVASAVITTNVLFVLGLASAFVGGRAILAATGAVPYLLKSRRNGSLL